MRLSILILLIFQYNWRLSPEIAMQTIISEIDRLKISNTQISELFRIYNDKLLFSGFSGTEPFLSEEVSDNLTYIINDTKLSELTHKFDSKDPDYAKLFQIYHDVALRYIKLSRIMAIFESHPVDVSRQGTHTSSGTSLTINFIRDTAAYFVDIRRSFDNYRTSSDPAAFVRIAIDEINPKLPELTNDDIQKINDIYVKYINSGDGEMVIDLYVNLLHRIITVNTGTPEGKDKIRFVNKSIERLKSDVLINPELKKIQKTNKKANTVQRLVQKNNLVPISLSMPFPELIAIITGTSGSKPGPGLVKSGDKSGDIEKTLRGLAKTLSTPDKKIGFILISKIITRPLEYNFWTLVDEKYITANKLGQPASSGVNETALRRYTTIFPASGIAENTGISGDNLIVINDEFIPDGNNFYYIIETITGNTFRLLVSWNIFDDGMYQVPAGWLDNLDTEYSPSRRLESYNCITDRALVKYLHRPLITLQSATRGEVIKDDSYWGIFRTRIKNLILRDISDAITNRFIEVGTREKLTYDKLEQTILDRKIYKAALNHITTSIKLDTISTISIDPRLYDQFQTELMMSYFSDLNTIEKYLFKDTDGIFRKFHRDKLIKATQSYIKEKKVYQIKNIVNDIMDTILSEVLEKFINYRSGIYLSIQKKFELVSTSLLK